MQSLVGRSFSHYRIEQELGRGGMGIVYKAYDTKLYRHIALKIISFHQHTKSKDIKSFLQEAQATAKLHHPNIVSVFEVGREPFYYFTMEYLPGKNLAQCIKEGKISYEQIAQILIKITGALELAHQNNIIHCDIKPSNIMLSQQPKLMDFGVAKISNQEQSKEDPLGTPAYMSPEQLKGLPVDIRTDIYSLGATLYEALTARPPFEGLTYVNILVQATTNEPISPRSIRPDIPKDLEAICLKCLEKKASLRYEDANSLAHDLQNFLDKQPVIAKSPTNLTYALKFARRHWLLSSLASIAFIFLILLITVYVNHKHNILKAEQLKTKAVQKAWHKTQIARKQAEIKKKESLQAAKKAFNILKDVYFQRKIAIQNNPELTNGLKAVFAELKRLGKLDTLMQTGKDEDSILWVYAVVYGGDQGIAIFSRFIEQDTSKNTQVFARYNRAFLYKEQKKFLLAQKDLKQIIKIAPNFIQTYRIYTETYIALKNYKKAENMLLRAIKLEPHNPMLYYNRANFYLEHKKNYHRAKKDLIKAIDLRSNQSDYYVKLGVVYQNLKQIKLALQNFKKAIALDPKNSEVYYQRGLLYQQSKDLINAYKDFTIGLQLDPKNAGFYNNRGLVQQERQLYRESIVDLNKSIVLDANKASAYLNRGISYLSLSKYKKAHQDFIKSIQLDPNISSTHMGLARVYRYTRQYLLAKKEVDIAIKLEPSAVHFYERGLLFGMQNKMRKAIKDLAKAVKLKPKNAKYRFYYGQTFLVLEKMPQAIRQFTKAIKLNPKDISSYNLRGYIYLNQNKYKRAKRDFAKAIELNPRHALSQYNLGCSYAFLKNKKRALQHLQQALKNGYRDFKAIKKQTCWNFLRKNKKFKAILRKYKVN